MKDIMCKKCKGTGYTYISPKNEKEYSIICTKCLGSGVDKDRDGI